MIKVIMKAKKIIMAVSCCFSVFCLVSCNLNDDDNSNTGLSQGEIQTAFNTVKNIHLGKLIYTPTGSSKNDTISITWDINTDSTMTIHNFPVSSLADNIGSDYSDIKTALEKEGTIDLHCNISFYNLNPVAFYINPIYPSFDLSYGGAVHKIQIIFHHLWNSFGVYSNSNNGILQMQLIETGFYVDQKRYHELSSYMGFWFGIESIK